MGVASWALPRGRCLVSVASRERCLVGVASWALPQIPPHIGGLRPPNPLTLGGLRPPQTSPLHWGASPPKLPYIGGGIAPPNPPLTLGGFAPQTPLTLGGASPPPNPPPGGPAAPQTPLHFSRGLRPLELPLFFQNPEMVQRRWSWAIFEDFHFFRGAYFINWGGLLIGPPH